MVLPYTAMSGKVIAYCMYRVCPLLQASARAWMHGDEATADGIVVW